MIKGLIIAVVLAALISVVTPAYSEQSLFGEPQVTFVSTDSDVLTVEGNGDTAEMLLVKEKGQEAKKISLDADNVLSIEKGDKVNVVDNEDFSRALITDSADKQKRIEISDSGEIDLSGYATGVYTLNVVVDGQEAYECIVVIGPQTEQVVQKEITRVNNKQITDVFIEIIFEIDCGEGYHLNEEDICVPNEPECDSGYILYNGECLIEDYDCAVDSEDPRCAQQLPPCEVSTYDTERRVCIPEPQPCYPGEPETCTSPTPEPCEPGYELSYDQETCEEIPEVPYEIPYDREAHCANQAGHEMVNGECIDLRDDEGPNPMEEIPETGEQFEEPEVPEEEEPEEPVDEEQDEEEEDQEEKPEEKSNDDDAGIRSDI